MTIALVQNTAEAMLGRIRPTRLGNILVPEDPRFEAEFSSTRFHFQSQQAARKRLPNTTAGISLQTPKVNKTDFTELDGDQMSFAGLTPSQAVRYISSLNRMMAQGVGESGLALPGFWKVSPYDHVKAMSAVRDCDRQYIDRLFGEPIVWGGFIAISADGSFVRTALDFSVPTIRLAAGQNGHFLEMAVKCWMHLDEELPDDVSMLARVDKGHITTSRYSLGLDGDELDQFTGLSLKQLAEVPLLRGVYVDPNETRLVAAVRRAHQLQFGNARMEYVDSLPACPVPEKALKSGVEAQVRVTAVDAKRRALLGEENSLQVLGEATAYDHNLLYGGRRVVVLQRPLGSDPLMPVSDSLWRTLQEIGVKLFAA